MSSLQELYDLVPVAEEVDLADQVRRERESRAQQEAALEQLRRFGLLAPGADADVSEAPVVEHDADLSEGGDGDGERLTDNQVVGLLEHLLGAEVEEEE